MDINDFKEKIPGWELEIEEVSPGVYSLLASNKHGSSVGLTETEENLDKALQYCIDSAIEIDAAIQNT